MKRMMIIAVMILTASVLNAQNLTIVHFNDTHSHIDPERSGDFKGRGGVIEQAAFLDSIRVADGKNNVLLVHAGDFSQGSSYFTELHGDIEIDIINALGFDAVCLGNHEFDNGTAELERRLSNIRADVVCANYDFSSSPLGKYVKPYTIVKKAGRKIGILGLLTDIRSVVDKNVADNFTYSDPVEVVNTIAQMLKNEKHCDMVICLSHLGYDVDTQLAAAIRNVDVIVGGHSHTHLDSLNKVNDLDGKPVVVVQNWKWGLNVGQLNVF